MSKLPLTMLKALGKDKWNSYVKDWHDQHPTKPGKPGRVNGNEIIRRYPNGQVDIMGTAEKAVRLINKQKENIVPLNVADQALLVVCMPEKYGHLMDASIAKAYCRNISDKDRSKIQEVVRNSFKDGDKHL